MLAGKGSKLAWGWTVTCPLKVSRDGQACREELDPFISQHCMMAGASSRYVFGIWKFGHPQGKLPE